MSLRSTIEYWVRRLAPFAVAILVLAAAVALILFVPARGAAALLGILAGAYLGFTLMPRTGYGVRLAVLWVSAAVAADAAYARLNDLAPVTVANGLTKVIDAAVKLAAPVINGVGLTNGDPRARVAAVSPDFVWALILSLIVTIVLAWPRGGGMSRASR
jgi:hypothetical protein